MSLLVVRRSEWIATIVALVAVVLAALLGGPGSTSDIGTIKALASVRAAHPGLTSFAIALTTVGGAPGMIAILVLVAAVLGIRKQWKRALIFAAIVLGGRGVVELIKLALHRPRPAFGPYPVHVSSFSFPSGHAANSMITFLAIAMVVVPARYRAIAVTAAVSLSGIIGATRPFLGVHWPSDVIAGWAFGIAWVVSLATASNYWLASDANPTIQGPAPTLRA